MVDISEDGKRFLNELFNRTGGDASVTVSMFDVGEAAGMDRERAGAAGEELIGWEMVEVRTLSGGIAIADDGIAAVKKLGGGEKSEGGARLGEAPVLDAERQEAVDRIGARLKSGVEAFGLGFERLAEIMADLKTLDAQLASPRPKTAVVREVFRSILEVLTKSDAEEEVRQVRRLLGER